MSKKSLKVLGGLALAALTFAFVYYDARKNYKKLTERDEANNKAMRDAGINVDDVTDPDIYNEDRDIVEDVYNEARFNSDIDIDALDTDAILGTQNDDGIFIVPPATNIVHITSTYNKMAGATMLNFLFEIPRCAYDQESRYNLGVGNFREALEGRLDRSSGKRYPGFRDTLRDLVFLGTGRLSRREMQTALEGYMYLTTNKGTEDEKTQLIPIPESVYINPDGDNKYSLTNYVERVAEDLDREEKSVMSLKNEDGTSTLAEIRDVAIMFRVSFILQSNRQLNGINKKTAIRCLKSILDDLVITGNRGKEFHYEHFMFYDSTSEDLRYFDTEKVEGSDKVTVSSFGVY